MKRILCLLLLIVVAVLSAQNAPLTLLSPNGGEQWELGSTQSITWAQVNLVGSVTLQLMGSSTNQFITIAQNIPITSGSFSWTIPATITPANNYRVKIAMGNSAANYYTDTSDAPFSIISGNPPPPPPDQFISVLSPNGGENWQVGSTHPITWTSTGLEGEVHITLVQANGVQPLVIAQNVPIDSGVFNWTIPATFPVGTGYKVHIVWLTLLAVYIGDMSDAPFTITAASNPLVQVLSPNGGEQWQIGNTYPITWVSAMLSGSFEVALMRGTDPVPALVIEPSFPGIMQLNWTIPATVLPGHNYKIRVRIPTTTGTFDLSDGYFSIMGDIIPPVSPLNITSPNGGEIWVKGTMQTITWTDLDTDGTVNIFLMRLHNNQTSRRIIARDVPNTGSFNWRVPRVVPVGRGYKIAISKNVDVPVNDISDNPFAIIGHIVSFDAAPNPTKESSTITIDLSAPVEAEISIFNLKGQKVRSLAENLPLSGKHSIVWDGKDSRGQRVNSGIYFIRINAGGEISTKRLIIMK